MPIISIANPKGGSGKSTTSLNLALEFARVAKVAVIDADPNAIIKKWGDLRKANGKKSPITIISAPSEDEMISTIDEVSKTHTFVIIDLEGTASILMDRAISRSTFVIVPLHPSPLDAGSAARAVKLVRGVSQMISKNIPYSLLWSKKPVGVISNSFKDIQKVILDNGLEIFKHGLAERAAYRDIFARGETLDELLKSAEDAAAAVGEGSSKSVKTGHQKKINQIILAKKNAHQLAAEVVETLKRNKEAK